MKEVIVELTVNEDDDTGVDIISFVESPAIGIDFQYFSDNTIERFKTVDSEKRIVVGAAMLPDEKIIRADADGKPYFVYFSKDTVKKCSEMFLKQSKQNGTNIDHSKVISSGVTVVESWIVENPELDKSKHLGYDNIPVGSWFVSYKVDNDELWNEIKEGKVLGFSIEGAFTQTVENESKFENELEDILNSCMSREEKIEALKNKVERL